MDLIKEKYRDDCAWCGKQAWHQVLTKDEQPEFEDVGDEDEPHIMQTPESTFWLVCACTECAKRSLLTVDVDYSQDWAKDHAVVWPKRSEYFEQDTWLLPKSLRLLTEEFFATHSQELFLASVMVLRAIADGVLELLNGQQFTRVKEALDSAVTTGHLDREEADNLHKAYEMGSAVIHRGHAATALDVERVWIIVHGALEAKVWEPKRREQKLKERAWRAANAAKELAKSTPPNPLVIARVKAKSAAKQQQVSPP